MQVLGERPVMDTVERPRSPASTTATASSPLEDPDEPAEVVSPGRSAARRLQSFFGEKIDIDQASYEARVTSTKEEEKPQIAEQPVSVKGYKINKFFGARVDIPLSPVTSPRKEDEEDSATEDEEENGNEVKSKFKVKKVLGERDVFN